MCNQKMGWTTAQIAEKLGAVEKDPPSEFQKLMKFQLPKPADHIILSPEFNQDERRRFQAEDANRALSSNTQNTQLCHLCGQNIEVFNGIFRTHDDIPPYRDLCRGSLKTPVWASETAAQHTEDR